jgi:putative sporulation protein YtaF
LNSISHLLLLSLAANLDNLGVGVAYGVRRIKVPALSNLVIAGIAFLLGIISILVGKGIAHFLNDSVANDIGASLLIGVAIWVMYPQKQTSHSQTDSKREHTSLLELLNNPEEADRDHSAVISWQESIVLGFALSVNVFTNGITAGLWNLDATFSALMMALFSFLTIWAGTWLGERYGSCWLGNKANIAAGIILLLLGIYELL